MLLFHENIHMHMSSPCLVSGAKAPPKKLNFPTSENRQICANEAAHGLRHPWNGSKKDWSLDSCLADQPQAFSYNHVPNLSSTILQVEMHTISGWRFPPWRKSSTSTGMISAGGAPLMQFSLGTISFAGPIAWYGSRMGHLKMTKHDLPDLVVPMSL